MAFYGCDFKYDSSWASNLELQIYDFDSSDQGSTSDFVAQGTIVSDAVAGRDDILLYGQEQKDTLAPHLVFGVNQERLDEDRWLTRKEIAHIAEWLTADGRWHWLKIKQEDMVEYRYKVVLESLQLLHHGTYPYAFDASFVADSAYAYMYPREYTWHSGENEFYNISTSKMYYKPTLLIHLSSGGDCSIVNHSDGDREFKLTGVPGSVSNILVDNANQIITDVDGGLNLYEYFNFNFFRAVKGRNDLTVTGSDEIVAMCEFPMNIGV